MSKVALLAVLWAGSVAGAWFLGGGGGSGERATPPTIERPSGAASAAEPRADATPAAPTLAGDPHAPARAARGAAPSPGAPNVGVAPATLNLDGVASPAEASAQMMAFAQARLAEGPEGHLALLKALDALVRDEQRLQALFGSSEEEAARWVYPWIKFAILHDEQIAAMTETIFATMAERPQDLADVDDDTLEVFVEAVPYALPAILPADRLDALRAHAKRILDTPESEQAGVGAPEPPADPARDRGVGAADLADALARLRSGDLDPRDALALLRKVPADALAQVDVAAIVGPLLEQGDPEVLRVLRRVRLDRAQLGALDARVVSGAGRLEPWWILQYLNATGRRAWAEVRPLFDQGLRAGGDRAERFAHALAQLPEKPPVEYVQEVLRTTTLPATTQGFLRGAFGLDR